MSTITRQALVDHLRHDSLRTDGRFMLRSGGSSDWCLAALQTTFDGERARLVGSAAVPDRAPVVGDPGARDRGAEPAVTG